MEKSIISAEKISYKVGKKYLLKDIDWEVYPGEHWVVFGMNGSGKTTLLSILSGYRPQTYGVLKVFGDKYSEENILQNRSKVGFVSSSFFDQIYRDESVLDIVLSGKSGTFGIRCEVIFDSDICFAKALLKELHIEDKINYRYSMLSKGERQNVLIARALISRPSVLILDEPCTGLDVVARSQLLNGIREIAEATKTTIIYVTHYSEEIVDVFEKCLLLKNGRCFAQGDTKEIFNQENISLFLEEPASIETQHDVMLIKINKESSMFSMLKGGGSFDR